MLGSEVGHDMSENQGTTSAAFLEVLTTFKAQIDAAIMPMMREIIAGQEKIVERQDGLREQVFEISTNMESAINILKQDIYKNVDEQHAKLRGLLLGRMDGLGAVMSQLRETVRNSWNTADYAIRAGSNLRNDTNGIRDEMDKLLPMISTMQKQQHLLESQVEILRRNAAEKDGDA